MYPNDNTAHDDTPLETLPDWLDADDLMALGMDEADIARLPIGHRGNDGRPCWHHEALPAILADVADCEVRA